MKKFPFIYLFVTVVVHFGCHRANGDQKSLLSSDSIDQPAETREIMKVIDNETNSFYAGNYDLWEKNWSHENYAVQAWNYDDGTFDATIGWDKIRLQGKDWIAKYYKNGKNIVHPDFKRDSLHVKFFTNNSAYLIWKQYNANKEKKYYNLSLETRIMEKKNEGWKIVYMSALWDEKTKIPIDSIR